AKALAEQYGVPAKKIIVTGDTKYDRVLERADAHREAAQSIREKITTMFPGRRLLVLGSVYQADWDLMFSAWRGSATENWLPILVPHHVDQKAIDKLTQATSAAGFKPVLWSRMEKPAPGESPVLIIDQMGMLAEIYASGEAAYIGGAQHAKVHNVLEPATY